MNVEMNPNVFSPKVGADIVSTIFTDLWKFITNPQAGTFMTVVGDFAMFYLIPFVAGYLRAEAYY
jgi:hypothetical protein